MRFVVEVEVGVEVEGEADERITNQFVHDTLKDGPCWT